MTFDPHPIKVMKPGNGPPLITLTEQKLELIADAGMDVILCLPFTRQFASISGWQILFRTYWWTKSGSGKLWSDTTTPSAPGVKGILNCLKAWVKALDFKVHVVPPVYVENILVSSTSIRNLVQEGKLHEAKKAPGARLSGRGNGDQGKEQGRQTSGISHGKSCFN